MQIFFFNVCIDFKMIVLLRFLRFMGLKKSWYGKRNHEKSYRNSHLKGKRSFVYKLFEVIKGNNSFKNGQIKLLWRNAIFKYGNK